MAFYGLSKNRSYVKGEHKLERVQCQKRQWNFKKMLKKGPGNTIAGGMGVA
jgi:hypothetical protein